MTLLTTLSIMPAQRGDTLAQRELARSDLTMVVPVKNNQTGVTRLLEACLSVFAPHQVCSGSKAQRAKKPEDCTERRNLVVWEKVAQANQVAQQKRA